MNFDLVIDLQCLARSAIFAWLANGRKLVGLDEVREGARSFYDFVVPRGSFLTHAVDWYLSVLPLLEVPVHDQFEWLPVRPEVAAAIRQKWPDSPVAAPPPPVVSASKKMLHSPRWIAIQPGARWANKRWPVENYTELVRQLAHRHPAAHFVILGAKSDQGLGSSIAEGAPDRSLNLCGKTTLPEMVEWIRRCDLMITNDTGPMHAAAALKKPLIALFGPTEPRRTGPYRQIEQSLRIDLPCSPCMKPRCHYERPDECLRAITPRQVLNRLG
jgi:ADP-heptose:LPS heptosyltransferase